MAEVVPIPLLWRGARQGGVVEPRLEPAADVYTDVGGRAASGTSGRDESRMDSIRAYLLKWIPPRRHARSGRNVS